MNKLRYFTTVCLLILFGTWLKGQQNVFLEDFEQGIIPSEWTIVDMNNDLRMWEADSRTAYSGEWCVGVSANNDGTKNDWLITPKLLPTDDNHEYSFYAKSQVPLPEMLECFKVKLSVTTADPLDFTILLGEETAIPAEWNQYAFDLSDYIGQEVYVALINESTDKAVMFADAIEAPYLYNDHDLKVTDITGPTISLINQTAVFFVSVKNNGWESQQNYDIVLYDETDNELSRINGPEITSFEDTLLSLSWTPQMAEFMSVYAEVEMSGDENPDNNRSKNWHLSVHAEGLVEVINGTATSEELAPLDFTMKTSLTESVYHAETINIMGNLTEIAYSANFTYELREKDIRVWIGETEKQELNMEWIPSPELELVYEGKITVPKGEWIIPLKLNDPYQYKGGNLVVMVEKAWDDRAYGFMNPFKVTQTDKLQTIQYINGYEATDPANPSVDIWWTTSSAFTPDIQFYFDVENMGSLAGIVTDEQSNAIENVAITSEELNFSISSATDGSYNIPYIYSGIYHLTASKHGYFDTEEEVSIAENQQQTLNFNMEAIPEFQVEGKITGSDQPEIGLEGANVTLKGYENYNTVTDESGYFSFQSVYTSNVYLLSVEAEGYEIYQMEVSVEGNDLDLGTIILNELTPPPIQVTANDFDMMAGISWIEPNGLPENEFRYDDGQIVSQLGLEGSPENAVFGAVHPSNSIITSISWFLTNEEEHDSVKLFIFGLDLMGKPDESNILFESGFVANTDNQWNEFKLPEYIDAPDGFFVGICTPGKFTSIGIDDGMEEPWEFSFGTNYVVDDWTAGNEWMDIGDLGSMQNLMIRANGYKFGFNEKNPQETGQGNSSYPLLVKKLDDADVFDLKIKKEILNERALEYYKVYRLLKGYEANEDQWEVVTENFSGTFYDDPMWSGVEPGVYRWAVKAVYTNDLVSPARFSNELVKEEKTQVTFNVNTNSGDPVHGANFSLQAEQGYPGYSHFAILDSTGQLNLNAVPLDTYKVDITLDGFEDFHAEGLTVNSDTSYTFELTELFKTPFNPLVVNGSEGSAIFSWNNKPDAIFEDFEAMENFGKELGEWTTVDVDGVNTMYMGEFDYPFNGEALGFISFNPQATEPAMYDIYAYSGERCAAAVNADMAESDDWLISPKITEVVDGSIFSFMARSSSDMWELEWFRVAVSTTGTDPQDFTVISEGDFLMAPYWNWQEFSFDLSSYAGQEIYVAIQHISFESYMLLIDDLFIGMPEEKSRSHTGYTVYLDGVEKGTTEEENFTFADLENGREYVAGVAANYTTGSSEIVEFSFTAVNTSGTDEYEVLEVNVYPNPSSGIFNFVSDTQAETEIIVYDSFGKEILRRKCNAGTFSIELTARGMYVVKLIQEKKVAVRKLLVK
ncbi:MAG: choice-of-anchor J domain-containing protein [Bacteroidetes bacterium]|jgi:hypothetical protein|nr:choice-of-anchor J domain-containing protein [Bacteroidota bacterium]